MAIARRVAAGLVLSWPIAGVAGAESPPARDLHVVVTLASGECVAGSMADRTLSYETGRDVADVPLSLTRAVERSADGETVRLRTADGPVRRWVLGSGSLEVEPAGGGALRVLPLAEVVDLRATPRIRIQGSGDAWWDLAFEHARGWDVRNDGDRLRVLHVDPAVIHTESHGPWSRARLSRPLAPFGDFFLEAAIAWDDEGAGERAMQNLYVTLYDTAGNEVVCAGHHDAWSATTGSRYARVAGCARESGYGTARARGRTDIRVVRRGGVVGVLFDGVEAHQGASAAPVARVVVQVDFYAYRGPDGDSAFGTMTLERLEIR